MKFTKNKADFNKAKALALDMVPLLDEKTSKDIRIALETLTLLKETLLEMHIEGLEVTALGNMYQVKKLKSLMLLTDPSVSHYTVGDIQLAQWKNYIETFPNEA